MVSSNGANPLVQHVTSEYEPYYSSTVMSSTVAGILRTPTLYPTVLCTMSGSNDHKSKLPLFRA